MNVYLITRTDNFSYEDYDSAVVIAESEEQAKIIHPASIEAKEVIITKTEQGAYGSWTTPDKIKVELIGTAIAGLNERVVCASYNAG